MLELYYKIWVDCLLKLRSIPANRTMWKFYGLVFMSMAMALNIALFMAILQRNILGKTFYHLNVDIFLGTKLDSFVSFFILYLAAPLLINYVLVFRNKRYEELFKRYKSYNGKLGITYLMVSYFLPFILLAIGFLIDRY